MLSLMCAQAYKRGNAQSSFKLSAIAGSENFVYKDES